MELNDFERQLFGDLAFFSEDTEFLGIAQRPLSMMSHKALEIMDVKLLHPDHGLDLEEESKQIAVYLWLHSTPVETICAALWSGEWRKITEAMEGADEDIVIAFREWSARLIAMIAATDIIIRPREISKTDKTPRDVVGPSALAFSVSMIANFTHEPTHRIKWHMFLPEAMLYYHAALRWHSFWTVRPGKEVKEADMEDLLPAFLKVPG